MKTLTLIVAAMVAASLIFTFWNHFLIRRHIRAFRKSHLFSSSLTDEKYFELRSKQEYIIACAIFLISGITFLGYDSLSDLKTEISSDFEKRKKEFTILVSQADSAKQVALRASYDVQQAKSDVSLTRSEAAGIIKQLTEIRSKNIIQTNIYIVDGIKFSDYKYEKDGYRTISFSSLRTISGQRLPDFKKLPSLIATSADGSIIDIRDLTTKSFKVSSHSYTYSAGGKYTQKQIDEMDFLVFDLWITEKP